MAACGDMSGATSSSNPQRAEALHAWAAGVGKARTFPKDEIDFERSSSQLRDCLRRGLVKMTDLRDDPEWFFEAHRIMGHHGDDLGTGFWTRFTVQYNLFAGTVIAVGNESQIQSLETMEKAGQLGCFGLTEKFAGVSSGLLVETIAEFDTATREFIITTPNDGAKKNWISQGFCADKSVVVCDLKIAGKSYGPHAFLIDFRTEKDGKMEVVPGISLADMGKKSVANDLDNAWISFDSVRVPESTLLDRYACIDEKGSYVQKQKGLPTMLMIGQRLFTGRVGVAEAANIFGKVIFERTHKYTDEKCFYAGEGVRPPLSMLPQLSSVYADGKDAFAYIDNYCQLVEAQLCACLRKGKLPPPALTDAIAVAKVRSVETSIQLIFRLKQTVGSYALMAGSGFEDSDSMQVAKFAEGESYVLLNKLVRDFVKQSAKKGGSELPERGQKILAELSALKPEQWIKHAEKVHLMAELIMDHTMEKISGKPIPRGIARPFDVQSKL